MHRKLSERDPVTAARLKPNDAQRIQRALEIIELTGQPMSQLLAQRPTSQLPFELILIALEPSDRKVLHERIARRFDVMLEGDALLHEVENLRQRGDLHPGLPAMRSVGYRQSWEFLDGQIDKKQLREKSIAATRQLAKRQLTWLRAMPERLVVDCLDPQAPQIVLDLIQKALEARE
jgi:tRNA dimethylallyltransferase